MIEASASASLRPSLRPSTADVVAIDLYVGGVELVGLALAVTVAVLVVVLGLVDAAGNLAVALLDALLELAGGHTAGTVASGSDCLLTGVDGTGVGEGMGDLHSIHDNSLLLLLFLSSGTVIARHSLRGGGGGGVLSSGGRNGSGLDSLEVGTKSADSVPISIALANEVIVLKVLKVDHEIETGDILLITLVERLFLHV